MKRISSTNQEQVPYLSNYPDLQMAICSRLPIGSPTLQRLLTVSKQFCQTVREIYKNNLQKIFELYANEETVLNCMILKMRVDSPSDETVSKIQQSLIQGIFNLGIPCRNRHLALEDIPRFNHEMDLNLTKIWIPIHQTLTVEEKPQKNASAQEIRTWMNANQNHLQEITQLKLSKKTITGIPKEVALLTGLQYLSLKNNKISVLSLELFDKLTQLGQLSLNYNQIRELPPTVFNELNLLQQLDLDHNQISELSIDLFNGLDQLVMLSLDHNRISKIPSGVFNSLAQLEQLYLNHNRVSKLPQDVFNRLTQLQTLSLSQNKINELPLGLFNRLALLEDLYLDNNKISVLPPGLLNGLIHLFGISLYHNQLSELPTGLFEGLPQLEFLYLYENPRSLFSYKDLPTTVSTPPDPLLNDLRSFREFHAYPCQTPFSRFYQFAAQGYLPQAVWRFFSALDPALQDCILTMAYKESNFNLGLKMTVRAMFDEKTKEQKKVVYVRILQLAQKQFPAEDYSNPNWGRDHTQDNILRLIDAMTLSS